MADESKYGKITTERGSIPADEPVFLLRAQDAAAVDTLEYYLARCRRMGASRQHLAGIDQVIDQFETWQHDHDAQVKTPDTAP